MALGKLTQIWPRLESLDVHWFGLTGELDALPMLHLSGMKESIESSPSRLQTCCLRGLHVTESDLLIFRKTAMPTRVTLTDTHLLAGTWTAILKHLADVNAPTTYCHLDDLEGVLSRVRPIHSWSEGTPNLHSCMIPILVPARSPERQSASKT